MSDSHHIPIVEQNQLEDIHSLTNRILKYELNGVPCAILALSRSQTITPGYKIGYIHTVISAIVELLNFGQDGLNKTIAIIPPARDLINLNAIVSECFMTYRNLCAGGQIIQNAFLEYQPAALFGNIKRIFDRFDLAVEHHKEQADPIFPNIDENICVLEMSNKCRSTKSIIWQFLLNLCVQNGQTQNRIWDEFNVELRATLVNPKNNPKDAHVCVSFAYNIFIAQSLPFELNEKQDLIVGAIMEYFRNQWTRGCLHLVPTDIQNQQQQTEFQMNVSMHLFMEYLLTVYTPFTKIMFDGKFDELTRLSIYKYLILFLNDIYLTAEKPIHLELFKSICTSLKEQSMGFLQKCAEHTVSGDGGHSSPKSYINLYIQIIATLSWIRPQHYYGQLLAEDIDLFKTVCGLLTGIHEIGKNKLNHQSNQFMPLGRIQDLIRTDNGLVPIEHERDISYRLKIFLIQIIGNTAANNKRLQDLARETQAFHTIFECTNLDARNPYIKEHSILAIRLLCERNEENLGVIKDMVKVGNAVTSTDLTELNLEFGTLRITPGGN